MNNKNEIDGEKKKKASRVIYFTIIALGVGLIAVGILLKILSIF